MDNIIKGNQNTTRLLNFLKQSTKQYPCLSKTEEQKLIQKYRNNRTKLNNLLFMHNIKIVFNQAKKYMSKVEDFDALVQDGMIGLGEAVNRFDIDKDVKFITYAVPWVRKYMLMHFYGKTVELDKRSMSIDSPTLMSSMKSSAGNEVTFENYINEYLDPSTYNRKTIIDELSANELAGICQNLYNRMENDKSLSAIDKAVFTDMFQNHEKTRDIAEKYNIEMSDVSEIKHKILSKFKTILVNEYNISDVADILAV